MPQFPSYRRYLVAILLILTITSFIEKQGSLKPFVLKGFAQGTSYQITYYAPMAVLSQHEADSVFRSIDSSLSIYKNYSLISTFNLAKRGVLADAHLKKVVQKAMAVSQVSSGLFDITVMPLVKLWGFGPDGQSTEPPNKDQIEAVLKYVGYQKIYFKGDSLLKKDPRITIDVNGIAQGYTVDVIADFLEFRNTNNYLVEVGGEIRVKGRKYPSGDIMKIGIESPPENPSLPETVLIKTLKVKTGAITTSGKYRNFYEQGGKKISHLMDPRTGYSLQTPIISATVYAQDAMTADAFDNVFMAMPVEQALKLVKKLKNVEVYLIYLHPNGQIADTASQGFRLLFQKNRIPPR